MRPNARIVTQGRVKCPCDLAGQAGRDMKNGQRDRPQRPLPGTTGGSGAWPDYHLRGPSPASIEAS
ncbi:hypothetical protein SXCC_03026 [Gluconacetobacter sp. SXCC-1]|nr:hypothetical protein SXCC_03026 [Gluconacetobacter sp. SXCC-1]